MSKTITIELTEKEMDSLLLCLNNGYGDGDFNEWLDRSGRASLQSGWSKMNKARKRLRQQCGQEAK